MTLPTETRPTEMLPAEPQRAVRLIPADETYALRHRALRPQQALADCRFPGDEAPGAFHLGAFDGDGSLLGVASFNPEAAPACVPVPSSGLSPMDVRHAWRLRGMATAPEARGQGHGKALLQAGIAELARRGAGLLWCNARLSAAGFYEVQGLARAGEDFDIPGIGGHVVMWRRPG